MPLQYRVLKLHYGFHSLRLWLMMLSPTQCNWINPQKQLKKKYPTTQNHRFLHNLSTCTSACKMISAVFPWFDDRVSMIYFVQKITSQKQIRSASVISTLTEFIQCPTTPTQRTYLPRKKGNGNILRCFKRTKAPSSTTPKGISSYFQSRQTFWVAFKPFISGRRERACILCDWQNQLKRLIIVAAPFREYTFVKKTTTRRRVGNRDLISF